jgi:hypothetical protein
VTTKRKTRATVGFGFDPAQSPHHFAVVLDRDTGAVEIEERFKWGDEDQADTTPEPSLKARLDAYRWSRISGAAADTFNRRLRHVGLATGTWSAETPLAPHIGKELTLLVWAVEDADPSVVPAMLANWLGLAPEERWWLYSTVNATSGHPEHGRDRGWRKAIKIAFAENPVNPLPATMLAETPPHRARRRSKAPLPHDEIDQPTLF